MLKKITVMVGLLLLLGVFTKEAGAFQMIDNFFNKLDLGYEEGAIIGVGVGVVSQPYIDVDARVLPTPMLNLQYKKFFVEGSVLGYYLHKDESFRLALVGTPRIWGYEPDDSSALTGMTKRGASFDGGLRGTLENKFFTTELYFLNDMTGEHEGQEVGLFIKREFLKGGFTPRAGIRWLSSNLVDHYFGVNGGEARPGRPGYEPDSAATFVVGATVALPINDRWAWVTDGMVHFLGDEIDDSPIVEDSTTMTFVTGLVYRY